MPYIYAHARTIPYADIVNTAPVTYHSKGHEFTEYSNTVITHIVKNETVIEFLYYAPFSTNVENVPVGLTEYSPSGNPNGPFVPLAPPKQKDAETPIDLSSGVPLVAAKRFSAGDPVFIRLHDPDQNTDSTKVDEAVLSIGVDNFGNSKALRVNVENLSEIEVIRLRETGPNTAVFTAYIQSKSSEGAAVAGDGCLSVVDDSKINASFTNIADGTQTRVAALVDPWGRVFDSRTGQPVNGVVVTIINDETGQPAEVFGDDRKSLYPSKIETGSRIQDGSGKVYISPDGSFRFPYVKPGKYRLEVETLKLKYTFPSKISDDVLRYLPAGPFSIEIGSRGETFEITDGPPFLIDIPIDQFAHEDPGMQNPLWLVKTSGKLNVSPGDFLAYTLNVSNKSAVKVDSIIVTDRLPAKFRYQKGSAKLENGTKIEPVIDSDGGTLTFFLGDIITNGTVKFTYVVKAAPGAKQGKAINSAYALAAGGYGSNIAKAEVQIVDDLFRSTGIIVGSVMADSSAVSDTTQTNGRHGVRGVRIYLEDGTYTVSDENGMFHFEGVRPGVHILQLDLDSLPEQYEVIPYEQGNRFAGRTYSQFVDLQGGTLWRSDFNVKLKPRIKGEARLAIRSAISDSSIDYIVSMEGESVPLTNLTLSLMLPDSSVYLPGTSLIDGNIAPDPAVMGSVAIFRIGEVTGEWRKEIKLKTSIPVKGEIGELITKGMLNFNTPLEQNKRTPVVDNVLLVSTTEKRIGQPDLVMHPHFNSFSSDLDSTIISMMDSITVELKKSQIIHLYVVGHSDNSIIRERSRHIFADNYALSSARALSIAKYLAGELNLTPSQLTVIGKGPDEPLASNSTPEGRSVNRRVEIRFQIEKVVDEQLIKVVKNADSTFVETTGLRPGEKNAPIKVVEEEIETMPDFNKAWLASAVQGFEIIWPSPEYSPPISSLKLAVKHDPKHVIKVTIDGKPVEPLNFESTEKNEAGSVAVSRWIGIDIHEGDNQFDVVAADSTGKEISRIVRKVHYSGPPVHIELLNDKSVLVADGRTTPKIAIRMTDKDGYPVRNGITGSFTLDKPYTTMQEMDKLRSSALNGSGTGNNYVIGKDGVTIIELQPTTRSGEAVLRFQFNEIRDEIRAWLKPEARDWILVGLAEDTMGFNTISGNVENLDDSDIREDYYENGRIAFFAKGKVKGSWLMTLSYDTARKTSSTGDDLSRTIDPDKYYTLYGDAAEQDYDAASTRKLYLKIERSQFYALFGVYNTGLTFTELSRYNRTFNGLKSEINNDRYSVNVFANETGQSFVKDEIRGDGTSGLYRLTRKNILVNSEKITIETRDRFRSEVIISSKNLTRHLDYNIDYDACTIFFKEPIMSKDESLNPIFIVIDYETGETSGDSFNYGGRGAIKFDNRKIEIGSTYLHESVDGNTGNLIGTDATVKIGTTMEFKGEVAHSNSEINGDDKKGSAYIAEMTRRSGKLDGKMYIREMKGNFGLGQQSAGEIGTRKLGFDSSYRFSQMFTMNQQLYRQYNLDKDGVRDLAEAKLNYTGDRYSTMLGFRHAEDRITDETNRSEQISLGGGVRMLNKKLQLRMTHDQTVSGNNANADFPTRTTAGVDYDVLRSATLFAEQEFTSGKKEDSQGTRLGVKTRPWNGAQIDTSVENKYSENSDRLFANLGLRQSLFVTKKLSADLGLDRSQSFKHPGNKPFNDNVAPSSGTDNDFTALSLGTNYHETKWSWTNRLETRFSDTDDKWGIMSGVYGELRKGLGLSGSAQILNTSATAGDKQNSGDIRFGLAYRPANSKWTVLNRLDFVQENNTINETEISGSKIVNNMNANYEFSLKTQFSFQYVAKYVLDTINGDEYSGYLDIFGIEMRKYLTKRFDIGVRGSALHSWDVSQYEYSAGMSLGFNIMHNIWLSAGYNFTGFEDRDYSSGNYTAQGPFLQFRSKFDQDTIKDALMIFGGIPKTESSSGKAAIVK